MGEHDRSPETGPGAPLRDRAAKIHERYANGNPRPLGGYLWSLAAYGGFAGSLAGLVAARGRLPARPDMRDVVLTGIATHKVSRMLAKDPITSPLRAPFTRFEGPAGDAELHESVRVHGHGHAVGELVTCPFCMSVWIATAFTGGLALAPRLTRAAAATFVATATSDTLQLAYDWLKNKATG